MGHENRMMFKVQYVGNIDSNEGNEFIVHTHSGQYLNTNGSVKDGENRYSTLNPKSLTDTE